jgi:hypothetical protein
MVKLLDWYESEVFVEWMNPYQGASRIMENAGCL